VQSKFIAGALLVFLVTSMFSSQSAFAGPFGNPCDGVDCNDNNPCTSDSCSIGLCINLPNIGSCDDGNVCTGGDFCSGGQCVPGTPNVGAQCGDAGTQCTNQDTCNFAGVCEDNGVQPDGSSCGDPNDSQCSNPDTCLTGACNPNDGAVGASCDLDADECTDDACDGSGTCEAGPPITGTPACFPAVGGEIIPIEQTSLLLAGAQTFSWMIPVVLSVLGIGLFVVSRKSE